MPIVYNDLVVEAQFRYTSLGEQVENVLWFENIAGVPLGEALLIGLAGNLLTWWDDALRPNQCTDTVLREIFLRQAIQTGGHEYTAVPLVSGAGAANEAQAPNNVTLCVSFRTGLSGRSYRGRNYFIGMPKSQIAGNQVTSAYALDIRSAYAQLPAALEGAGDFRHVVYTQFTGGGPRTGEGLPIPVVSYVLTDRNIDSQRRRLAGRGS